MITGEHRPLWYRRRRAPCLAGGDGHVGLRLLAFDLDLGPPPRTRSRAASERRAGRIDRRRRRCSLRDPFGWAMLENQTRFQPDADEPATGAVARPAVARLPCLLLRSQAVVDGRLLLVAIPYSHHQGARESGKHGLGQHAEEVRVESQINQGAWNEQADEKNASQPA